MEAFRMPRSWWVSMFSTLYSVLFIGIKCQSMSAVVVVAGSCATKAPAVWLCAAMPSTMPLAAFLRVYWLLSPTWLSVPMSVVGPLGGVGVVAPPPDPHPETRHRALRTTTRNGRNSTRLLLSEGEQWNRQAPGSAERRRSVREIRRGNRFADCRAGTGQCQGPLDLNS